MLDASSLPTERGEKAAWLLEQEERIAALVRAALHDIVVGAYESFISSLTAAVDLVAFDGIPDAWMTFVHEELLNELGEMHLAGAATAWLGATDPTEAVARAWETAVNHNAESYIADATNRLARVGDETWKLVRTQVENGITQGLTNEELKDKIGAVGQFSEQRADTIARTEANGAYVQGDLAGAKALGDDGPLEKVWVATLDDRTREWHADAHDQCVLMDEMFDVDGEPMDAPHDPSASAGNVVNCRCYVEFLYAGDKRPDGSVVGEDTAEVEDELAEDEPVELVPTELGSIPTDADAMRERALADREALAAQYASPQAALDARQVDAIERYQAGSDMNMALRAGEHTAREVELNDALTALGPPQSDAVVYRAVGEFDGLADMVPGTTYTDRGFMSSFVDPEGAASAVGRGDAVFQMEIPKGGPGAYYDGTAAGFEQEFIVKSGTQWDVVDRKLVDYGWGEVDTITLRPTSARAGIAEVAPEPSFVNIMGQKVPTQYVSVVDGDQVVDWGRWQADAVAERERAWSVVEQGKGTVTGEQARSVSVYQSAFGNYHGINGSLRAGTLPSAIDAGHIANLDAAMQASSLPQPLETWRAVNFGSAREASKFVDALSIGGEFADPAYFSTSTDLNRAAQWLGPKPERGVLFKVNAPAGTHYVALAEEAEVLYPRGTAWRITDVFKDDLGYTRVHVEAV